MIVDKNLIGCLYFNHLLWVIPVFLAPQPECQERIT